MFEDVHTNIGVWSKDHHRNHYHRNQAFRHSSSFVTDGLNAWYLLILVINIWCKAWQSNLDSKCYFCNMRSNNRILRKKYEFLHFTHSSQFESRAFSTVLSQQNRFFRRLKLLEAIKNGCTGLFLS